MEKENIEKLKNMSAKQAAKFLEEYEVEFDYLLDTIWVIDENREEVKITFRS